MVFRPSCIERRTFLQYGCGGKNINTDPYIGMGKNIEKLRKTRNITRISYVVVALFLVTFMIIED